MEDNTASESPRWTEGLTQNGECWEGIVRDVDLVLVSRTRRTGTWLANTYACVAVFS